MRHRVRVRSQIGNQPFAFLCHALRLGHIAHHDHCRVSADLITIEHRMRMKLQMPVQDRIMRNLVQRFALNHLLDHLPGQRRQIAGGQLAGRMQQLMPVLSAYGFDAPQIPFFHNAIRTDDLSRSDRPGTPDRAANRPLTPIRAWPAPLSRKDPRA